MALAGHDHFAVGEARARRKRSVEVVGGVDAFEPVAEERGEAGVAEMEQVGQARQRAMRRRGRGRRRREEGQARRRRVGREGADGFETADLERAEPLAQGRFERRLPTGLDADPRPQACERVETVAREPGLELVLDLDLFLQRLQRRESCAELGVAPTFIVDAVLQAAPGLGERGDPRLPIDHRGERGSVTRVGRSRAFARLLQLGGLDRDQPLRFGQQPLAPRLGLGPALVDAARFGREHLDLLLHGGHRAALLVAARLRFAQRFFGCTGRSSSRLEIAGECFGVALGRFDLGADPGMLVAGLGLARTPRRALRLELDALARQSLAPRSDVADPLLEPAHFERGLSEQPLCRMERVVGLVVRLTDRFELGLGPA